MSVIAVEDVHFAYGADPVLAGVSFDIDAQSFVALAGANGSGKSTLLRLILGLLPPSRGRINLLGHAPGRMRDAWRVGYVPQRSPARAELPATVREVVATGRLARRGWHQRLTHADNQAIEHALASVEVDDLAHRRLGELSGGQAQRVLIAKALVNEPDVLILDEPVAGVDVESQRRFRDALVHLAHEHAATIFLVSHEFGAVEDCLDRVIVLQGGRISFDGTPAELRAAGVSLGVHSHDLPVWLEERQT